ncbi:MUL1 [Blepharisma stoltei]|uniref:RING-type domain-containing protein n=1 Tax=Blepharisma stoltei TaxID=1481888 RepID=A0AAU9JS81_9CILI|nr:unnamed protein product [Blepharisma stoltei]
MDDIGKWIYGIGGVCTLIIGSFAVFNGINYWKYRNLKDLSVQDLVNNSENNPTKLVCVSGIVSDKNAFKPIHFKNYGKIVYSDTIEYRYAQSGRCREIHDRVISQFSLVQGRLEIMISPSNDTNIYTNTIYSKSENLSPSFELMLQGVMSFISSWFGSEVIIPVEVFHEVEEKVISCNSAITAIGKFSKTNGKITVIPDHIGFSKNEILRHLRKNLGWLWATAVILGCVFVVPAIRRLRKRRNLENQYRNIRENIPEGFHCVICLENPRDTLIEPCKHLCVCRVCCDSLNQCPVCRAGIQNTIRIYYP